jgi:hypothetical protein
MLALPPPNTSAIHLGDEIGEKGRSWSRTFAPPNDRHNRALWDFEATPRQMFQLPPASIDPGPRWGRRCARPSVRGYAPDAPAENASLT